jgi:hypothetical protein
MTTCNVGADALPCCGCPARQLQHQLCTALPRVRAQLRAATAGTHIYLLYNLQVLVMLSASLHIAQVFGARWVSIMAGCGPGSVNHP